MSAYCMQSDLVERFGTVELQQLTDEATAGTTIDTGEVTKACDEATSLIDSYVAARYITPLAPVPTIVRRWACDITRKFLWKDRAKEDSVVTLNYKEALRGLADVAKSVASLPDTGGVDPIESGFGIAVASSDRVFTDELLAGM